MNTTSNNNIKDSFVSRKESVPATKDLVKAGKEDKSKLGAKETAKESEADKFKKFENEGVVFKAKLIGSELVMEPRGDKMCQNSIQRLKAIIKGTNSHKKRIVLKISYDGVKVYDEKTNEILHHHEVAQISYIASDDTDSRCFGYVSDVPNKAHQFICFKTVGPAISVMSVISTLFEAVLERKNQSGKGKGEVEKQELESQDSNDLIGDSGIAEGDMSLTSDDKQQQQSSLSSLFENIIASPGNSFASTVSNTINDKNKKQSTSTDLIFDDLFSGLSDPIIVDKNESLISYKPDISRQQAQHRMLSGSLNIPDRSRKIPEGHQIPRRRNPPPVLLPPPSSLPRPAPMMSANAPPSHNRSLVYNHSSVSLSDASLVRQSSFASTSTQNDSYVDRYAVFNDIDNLPSIFESTSLGSVNNIGNSNMSNLSSSSNNNNTNINNNSTSNNHPFRQTNPFDDDFFA